VDVRCLAIADIKGITPPSDVRQRLEWQYKLLTIRERNLKTNTAALLTRYGIEFDKALLHDALYDARMTKKIYDKLIWKLDLSNVW
jgi:DNA polymerase III epsilon subunit-like protein